MPEASPATGASESAETKVATESEARTVASTDVKADSSTAVQTDAKPESSTGQADKPASMLDAIKAVSAKTAAASPAADGGQTGTSKDATGVETAKDSESEELPEDPTDEELARYHSKTRKRVTMLKTQRDEARARLKEVEPLAEAGSSVTAYMQKHELTGDEVNTGFSIMAAMKGDPFVAKAMLEPYWNALCALTGQGQLPTDLQKAVDEGRIEEGYAREVAANRSRAEVADSQRQRVERRSVDQEVQRTHAEATGRIQSAIDAWERKWMGSDPDYRVKSPRTMEKFENALLKRSVQITTPEQAVAFLEKCRQAVEDEMKPFLPKRGSVTPVSGVAAVTGSLPKPTSMLEAMKLAAARAG